MAIQNLADLRTRVREWANRKDLSDSLLNDFINIAQTRLNRLLRIPVLESEAVISYTNDSGYGNGLLLPRDYIDAIQLTVDTAHGTRVLQRKDIQYVEPIASGAIAATPMFFARKGNTFYVAPRPSNTGSATLYYYIALQPLVEDTDSNWFVADAPDALLYGSLTELSLYIKADIAAQQWEAKFQNAAQEVQHMADQAQWSGGTLAINSTGVR